MNELTKVFTLLQNSKPKKSSGSDYTATVTHVEGKTAYVQITGADISDTPVALSIDAKPGDLVRVRVNNGKAWITGNDTAPPTNNTDQINTITKTGTGNTERIKNLTKSVQRLLKHIKALEAVTTEVIQNQSTVLSNVAVTKAGRVVTVQIRDGSAQTVAANTSLLQLDSKYAPLYSTEFVDSYGKKRMVISDTGVIKNIEALTTYCRGSVTYISAT